MPGSSKSDYKVLEVIGRGSYGKCEKIQRKVDGKVPSKKGTSSAA